MIDEKVLIERLEGYRINEKIVAGTLRSIVFDEVKEIVKDIASEHNNDFCEWRKVNSNEYVCDAHAETHDSIVLDWCVCPYCGKEIKVVE